MYGVNSRDGGNRREGASPVYQIDFTAVDSGKRIASTKRRIRWRFGFSNQDALNAGETGTACRGEEHDITLIWSITSGKRLVLADGQEVHYSNNRSHLFDFSWTLKGNHVLKVVAHANPPANASQAFRQYDFFVDGMSFFNMPKVYRLGLVGAVSHSEPTEGLALATSTRGQKGYSNYAVQGSQSKRDTSIVEIEAPKNVDEEQAYLAEAIKNSLKNRPEADNRSLPPPKQDDMLVDMMSEPGIPTRSMNYALAADQEQVKPTSTISIQQPSTISNFPNGSSAPPPFSAPFDPFSSKLAPPAALPSVTPMPNSTSMVTSTPSFASTNHSAASSNPIVQPPAAPYNPFFQPPAATFASANLGSLMQPPAEPAKAPASMPDSMNPIQSLTPVPGMQPTTDSMKPPTTTNTPMPPAADAEPVKPSASSAPVTMAPASVGLGADADVAFAKFAQMDQFDLVSNSTKDQGSKDRNNPFDDVISKPPAPTLAGMKAMGTQSEKKEVMKPGAMVVSENQQGNWGTYSGVPGQSGYGQTGSINQPMQMGQGLVQSQAYVASPGNVTGPVNRQVQPQGQQYGYQQPYGQPQAAQGYNLGTLQPQQQR